MHTISARRLLACLVWLVTAVAAQAQQTVSVPSLDMRDAAAIPLPAFWFPASLTSQPAAAMLLLHGCGGPYAGSSSASSSTQRVLSQRMTEYARWLNERGVHALVLDSLTPRGETEICTQKYGARRVTSRERRRDALGAFDWLAKQPNVDASRLGVMGWSHGGTAVLATIDQRFDDVSGASVAPSLAVAYYPGCGAWLREGLRANAPLTMLLGEADDWTPPGPCIRVAERAQSEALGAEIEVVSYPGAYHGFDGTTPVRLRKDVPNGVKPGQGVHVGGDPIARKASRVELERVLRARGFIPVTR